MMHSYQIWLHWTAVHLQEHKGHRALRKAPPQRAWQNAAWLRGDDAFSVYEYRDERMAVLAEIATQSWAAIMSATCCWDCVPFGQQIREILPCLSFPLIIITYFHETRDTTWSINCMSLSQNLLPVIWFVVWFSSTLSLNIIIPIPTKACWNPITISLLTP